MKSWFDTTTKRAAGLLTLAALVTMVYTIWAVFDSTYARSSGLKRVEDKIDNIGIELKVGQALSRRSLLQAETRQLQGATTRTNYEAARLATVEIELRDVEKEIDMLRKNQGALGATK